MCMCDDGPGITFRYVTAFRYVKEDQRNVMARTPRCRRAVIRCGLIVVGKQHPGSAPKLLLLLRCLIL